MSDQIVNENDVFRILVATDNHLGYNENDALTGTYQKQINSVHKMTKICHHFRK